MTNDQIKNLCLQLMKADSEDEVVTYSKKMSIGIIPFIGDIMVIKKIIIVLQEIKLMRQKQR